MLKRRYKLSSEEERKWDEWMSKDYHPPKSTNEGINDKINWLKSNYPNNDFDLSGATAGDAKILRKIADRIDHNIKVKEATRELNTVLDLSNTPATIRFDRWLKWYKRNKKSKL